MLHCKSESERFIDRDTGAEVIRLTSHEAPSNHIYFTNNSFYDNGRKIVFESDRTGIPNFFSLDLKSGEIDQLTELEKLISDGEPPLYEAFVDPVKNNCCFFLSGTLYRLSLGTLELTPIYTLPKGFINHIISIAPDGEYVYTSIVQYDTDRLKGDLPLREIMERNPISRIIRIPIDGGPEEILREEQCFIAHVNISPTDKKMLTYCHEGPWYLVDHRLWYLNTETGEAGKLHPCEEGEFIGHEYWYADGKRIGYHGSKNDSFHIGSVNSDGSGDRSFDFPFRTGHTFSLDEKLIVGDGNADGKFLRLWRLSDDGYEAPRALCRHDCSFRRQRAHVHPRFTPDGKSVLYTSDMTGVEQIYLAKLPEDISSLPMLESLAHLGAR